jgi:hypothetical protein
MPVLGFGDRWVAFLTTGLFLLTFLLTILAFLVAAATYAAC